MSEIFRYIESNNTEPPICSVVVQHLATGRRVSAVVAGGSLTSVHLCIFRLNPSAVETVVPEGTRTSVRAMRATAVDAADRMGARLVGSCGRNGRFRLGVTLVA